MRLMRAALFGTLSFVSLGASPAVPTAQLREDTVVEPREVASVDDLLGAASSMMDEARWDEAIRLLTLVIEIDPANGLAHANRAIAYGWTNRLEEASDDLAAAEKLIPGRAVIHRIRAILADRRGEEDIELAELTKSLALEPDNVMALRFRANIFNNRREEAAALRDADAYIRAFPDDPDAYAFKARLLRSQLKRELAEAEAKRIAKQFPDNANAISIAARIYDDLGNRLQALQEITRAIAIEPDSARFYEQRAKFRHWKDIKGRRQDLEAAMALDADDNGIILDLALLNFDEKRWNEAIVALSIILTSEPKDYGIIAYRGMARERAGDQVNAVRDYQAAMAAASGAADFELICELLAFESLALEQARTACNRAIELDPERQHYRYTRGLVELRSGRLDAARSDFDAAIKADDRLPQPFYGRALARWRQGDREGAIADMKRAHSIQPDIDEKFRQYGFADLPED